MSVSKLITDSIENSSFQIKNCHQVTQVCVCHVDVNFFCSEECLEQKHGTRAPVINETRGSFARWTVVRLIATGAFCLDDQVRAASAIASVLAVAAVQFLAPF